MLLIVLIVLIVAFATCCVVCNILFCCIALRFDTLVLVFNWHLNRDSKSGFLWIATTS